MATIELKDITFGYDRGEPVLEDLNLRIEDGELHTLLGPSGCGKSTTLRLVAGFLTPRSGRILLDGEDITHLPPEKRRMGMVFQNYALFPQMTVSQNIAYGLKVARVPKAKIASIVSEYLDLIGLGDFGNRNAMELSGGQQQRVAIARALAPSPRVLLLDEPMSNLDVELRQRMRDEIRRIQQSVGVTTLFITHDQQDALSLSDVVSVMHDHIIQQTGLPRDIYEHPATEFVATFMGVMNYLPGAGPDGGDLRARPEQLALTAAPTEHTVATGTVSKALFQGFAVEYTVHCDGAEQTQPGKPGMENPQTLEVLSLNNRNTPTFAVGDQVYVEPIL